jgi:hypothetical protein
VGQNPLPPQVRVIRREGDHIDPFVGRQPAHGLDEGCLRAKRPGG